MAKQNTLMVLSMALALVGFFASTNAQNIRTETKVVTAEELQKMKDDADRAEATPVQTGVMTPRQREHSKLYSRYSGGLKIHDGPAMIKDIRIDRTSCGAYMPPEDYDFYQIFSNMAKEADAVVIGVVKDKSSQITEDDYYIFTDYEIKVVEGLKENLIDPLGKHEQITVTRPGGSVLLDGHLAVASDDAFPPFYKGLTYLLFLKYIPSTSAYQTLDSRSSFLLIENKVVKLTKEYFPLEYYFTGTQSPPVFKTLPDIHAGPFLDFVRSVCY